PRALWACLDAWAYSTTRRFWGDFGWYDTHISGVVVAVATAVCLLALAVGCAGPDRVTGTPRSFRLLLVAPLLALIVGQFSLAVRGYINTGRMAELQGRYWFGAVAGLAVVVGLGLANRVGRRQRWLPLGALAAVAGMQLAAMSTIFGLYWGEPGSALADRVRAVVAWAALPGELLRVGADVGVVAVAGGLWSGVGSARLPRVPAPPRRDAVRADWRRDVDAAPPAGSAEDRWCGVAPAGCSAPRACSATVRRTHRIETGGVDPDEAAVGRREVAPGLDEARAS